MARRRLTQLLPVSTWMEADIAALGCFLPFVLLVLGAVAGALAGGASGAYWGCGIGLALGIAIGLGALGWWERLRSGRG